MRAAPLLLCALAGGCRALTVPAVPGRGALAAAAAAVHHLLDPPPPAALCSTRLDELTNAVAPGAEHDVRAFVARPAAAPDGRLPVLLLLHEFFGLTAPLVEKAQGLADELSCVVIAPDTFRGQTTSFVPKAIWLALSARQERVNADLDAVLRWAATQEQCDTSRLAVMGFCYGGGKALRYTTQCRPTAATVVFYGEPLLEPAAYDRLRAPVCAVYGVDDLQFPQRVVTRFKAALEAAGVEHEVMSYYGAGHAFWRDMRQVEEEEMPTIAAWRLSTNFLRNHFQGKESFARKRAFLEWMLESNGGAEPEDEAATGEDSDEEAAAGASA
jgi:carboxymethylenebutenolidase